MLYKYLKDIYVSGEPIFSEDINLGLSEEILYNQLMKLTNAGLLRRFGAGVYYIPQADFLGKEPELTVDAVARHRYIERKGRRIGYYSGYTLANRMGLSTQVPYVEEITSNLAPAQFCEADIKNRRYILRRPMVEITRENVAVLQFLDCLINLKKCADEEPDLCRWILTKYVEKNAITKELADQYLAFYPVGIQKTVYDMGAFFAS